MYVHSALEVKRLEFKIYPSSRVLKNKKVGPLSWVLKESIKLEEKNTRIIIALAPVELCDKCLLNDLLIFL